MAMFKERRQFPRRVVNRMAQFHSEICSTPRAILLTDLSESGARLFTDLEMPPTFTLSITDDGVNEQHDCRAVWHLGHEIGIKFTTPARL